MNPNPTEIITSAIEGILSAMGLSGTVEAEDTVTKGLVFNIALGQDSYMLIGHRGGHLHALEILLQAMVARKLQGQFVRFSLDVDDYRRKREWYIKETVHAAVKQLQVTGRAQALIPMPNYERKFVHALVQDQYPGAVSTSNGPEPRRRVVIRMKHQAELP
jgi:spoIIIJ-associated protein